MAIIKCPDCKNNVSDKASSCPNCGYPIDKMDILYYRDIKDDEIKEIHTLIVQEKFNEAIKKCSDLLPVAKNKQVLKKQVAFMMPVLDKHITECQNKYEEIIKNNLKIEKIFRNILFFGGIISIIIPFIIWKVPSISNFYLILFIPVAIIGIVCIILSFIPSEYKGEDENSSAYKEMCNYSHQKHLCIKLLEKCE